MLTIVLPNRNRKIKTVKNTLDSLLDQWVDGLRVIIVDYGSTDDYQKSLKKLVNELGKVKLIVCPSQQQLWNKSRAINIALKQCSTDFFMVADMDMIFHPNFLAQVIPTLQKEQTIYFPVGILTQQESEKELPFEEYEVKFITNEEATGITIFPTQQLKALNGFDEFYHGWGSEDTDAHIRLRNSGQEVQFKKNKLYFLHQWHPKSYRSKDSKAPYCSILEQVNSKYLNLTKTLNRKIANTDNEWGVLPTAVIEQNTDLLIKVTNLKGDVLALIRQLHQFEHGSRLRIEITHHSEDKALKNSIKKLVGKKTFSFYSLDQINDMLLFELTGALRNSNYRFYYENEKVIRLFIEISNNKQKQ